MTLMPSQQSVTFALTALLTATSASHAQTNTADSPARESNLRQADIASRRALELEPGLAEAHVARGIAVTHKAIRRSEPGVRDCAAS